MEFTRVFAGTFVCYYFVWLDGESEGGGLDALMSSEK